MGMRTFFTESHLRDSSRLAKRFRFFYQTDILSAARLNRLPLPWSSWWSTERQAMACIAMGSIRKKPLTNAASAVSFSGNHANRSCASRA